MQSTKQHWSPPRKSEKRCLTLPSHFPSLKLGLLPLGIVSVRLRRTTLPEENSPALPISCTKVNALKPSVACQQAKYEAPPSAPAVVASTAVLQVSPGLTSHGTALPEATRSVLDEHAV